MLRKIVRFELKKITSQRAFLIIFAFIVIVTVFLATMDLRLERSIYDAENNTASTISEYELKQMEKEIFHLYSGKAIDNASVRDIIERYEADSSEAKTWQRFNVSTIFWWINNVGMYEIREQTPELPITESVTADLYYQNMLSDQFSNYESELTEPEANYWKNQLSQINTPFEWQFGGGWYSFCEICHRYSILATISIVIACCTLFPSEHRYKTDALVLSSVHGRKKVFTGKLISGIIISVCIAGIIYGVGLLVGFFMYGVEGYSVPVQLYVYESAYNMTFGTAAILLLLLGIISSVMTGVFVMMLSEVFRSMIPAIIIPIILVTFAAIGTSTSSINVFLGYHPVIKIGLDVLREHNLITLGSIVINPFCACFVIYVLFTLICIPICRWSYSRYQIGSR